MVERIGQYEYTKTNHDYTVSIGIVFGLFSGRLAGIADTILQNGYSLTFFSIEMHHFYYGLFIFLASYFTFFMIPQSNRQKLSLFEGMGVGIMLDDIHLIMKLPYIPYESVNAVYMKTWPSFILFLLFSIAIMGILHNRIKKQK